MDLATRWLKSPDLVLSLLDDFKSLGVVGEERNLLACYLALTSRLSDNPVSVIIQSSSSAGKTTIAECVLSLMPEDSLFNYSALSGQALYYLGEEDLRHKILSISEDEGVKRASYALKLLVSEGRLKIGTTGKDVDSGRLLTKTYQVKGPVSLIITTTTTDVDNELLNRLLVLSVDEDAAQTRRIVMNQRRLASIGVNHDFKRDEVISRHRTAQSILRPYPVIVPVDLEGPKNLNLLRSRRDIKTWLSLVSASALFHQLQRDVVTMDRNSHLVATALDAEVASSILKDHQAKDLSPGANNLLEMLTLIKDKSGSELRFSRRDLVALTGWSNHVVTARIKELVDHDMIVSFTGSRGRRYHYGLVDESENFATLKELSKHFAINVNDPPPAKSSNFATNCKNAHVDNPHHVHVLTDSRAPEL